MDHRDKGVFQKCPAHKVVRGFVLYNFNMTRSAIFRWLMISVIAGIGIGSFLSVPIIFVWLIGVCAMMVFAGAWKHSQPKLLVAMLVVIGMCAGITRMNYAKRYVADFSIFSGKHAVMTGRVTEDPKFIQSGQRMFVSVDELQGNRLASPVTISVITRSYPRYAQGDMIRAQGMFEAKAYDGVSSGILFSNKEEKIGQTQMPFLLHWMREAKHEFNAHIERALPEPHASFMKGLLLGEKTSMPPELLAEFKEAGVSHIVALSGYNITLVGTLLVDILLMVTVPFWLTFWAASVSIVLFVLLTGASASLVRAAIMGILVLVAMREGRMYHMTNALVCAGMIMLFLNPYLLRFDRGFQLSFLATLGLIYLTSPVERFLGNVQYMFGRMRGRKQMKREENRMVKGIKKAASETIAAQLAVLPLLVYVFGGVSLIAPVSNLFVLAMVPVAMALGFFTGVAGFASVWASTVLGWCAWLVVAYELAVIHMFSRMPFAFLSVSSGAAIVIAIVYMIVASARQWRQRKRANAGKFVVE
ncbi:MAG: ComEC/Rec2 family competence protein [bacterium]|nr:ComEC/Rec2 family competence protein [bacterium]